MIPNFILASASPRRRELLQQIGCHFDVVPAMIDETVLSDESPIKYVERMALKKASSGWRTNNIQNLPVMGADTIVVLGEKIFGKPKSCAHAIDMLMSLSNKTHLVLSAVAMVSGDISCEQKYQCARSETRVTFNRLSEDQCLRYWKTGEPEGKAGAYAIQGKGAVFVSHIEGSYSGVVGLPLVETCQLLSQFDIPYWMSL